MLWLCGRAGATHRTHHNTQHASHTKHTHRTRHNIRSQFGCQAVSAGPVLLSSRVCIAVAMTELVVPIRVAFDGIRFEADANGEPVMNIPLNMTIAVASLVQAMREFYILHSMGVPTTAAPKVAAPPPPPPPPGIFRASPAAPPEADASAPGVPEPSGLPPSEYAPPPVAPVIAASAPPELPSEEKSKAPVPQRDSCAPPELPPDGRDLSAPLEHPPEDLEEESKAPVPRPRRRDFTWDTPIDELFDSPRESYTRDIAHALVMQELKRGRAPFRMEDESCLVDFVPTHIPKPRFGRTPAQEPSSSEKPPSSSEKPPPRAAKQWLAAQAMEGAESAPTATAVSGPRSTPWLGAITLPPPSPEASRLAVPLPPGLVPLELHTPGCTQPVEALRQGPQIPNQEKCKQQ